MHINNIISYQEITDLIYSEIYPDATPSQAADIAEKIQDIIDIIEKYNGS